MWKPIEFRSSPRLICFLAAIINLLSADLAQTGGTSFRIEEAQHFAAEERRRRRDCIMLLTGKHDAAGVRQTLRHQPRRVDVARRTVAPELHQNRYAQIGETRRIE